MYQSLPKMVVSKKRPRIKTEVYNTARIEGNWKLDHEVPSLSTIGPLDDLIREVDHPKKLKKRKPKVK